MYKGRQRSGPDEVDTWGMQWARQRRIALGIIDPELIEPRERLGKLRCTLGYIQKDRVASGETSGKVNQDFPEVYTGTAMLVHRAYQAMPGELKLIMHLHYVWKEIDAKDKCGEAGVNVTQYWVRVGMTKSFLRGALAIVRQSQKPSSPSSFLTSAQAQHIAG